MNTLSLTGLGAAVAQKVSPFVNELLEVHASNMHSIHVVGSAATPDYNEKLSDVNSVVVLRNMELAFIEFLAPLGKKLGKHGIAAPLVMTPSYIEQSLDAFPIEFFDFKLIHKTIYGDDVLAGLTIHKQHLRLQCEREVKTKLIGLRQGYLSSLGRKKELAALLVRSFTGSMPLFRAIISLVDGEPPVPRRDVLSTLGNAAKTDTAALEKMLLLKTAQIKPSELELHDLFKSYYAAIEALGKIVDDLHA
jgi:hypothetical protein